MQVKAISIRELYERFAAKAELPTQEPIVVEGWVRTNRNSGSVGFIELHDGTCFKNLQLVYSADLASFNDISHFRMAAAIEVKGKLVLTPEMKQPFELHVLEAKLLGD
jgi:asparaginyl-tRNA synthetase